MAATALQPQPQPATQARAQWSLGLRIAFRFFFCYWILCWSTPHWVSFVDPIPGSRAARRLSFVIWRAICPWVAVHIFHLSGKATTYFPTGSTDSTLSYIQIFCYVVLACVATMVWSLVDRKRTDYQSSHDWLRVLVRYTLAVTMLWYGISKIFPGLQFQMLDGTYGIGRLIEPYGQLSPASVLWTFMGSSRPYTVFTGIAEIAGCVLLLFRRTSTLGAMVSAAALLNVVMLNLSYDVAVKLASLNYLLMAIFLLVPDAGRLMNVLVLNRPTTPADLRPLWPARRWTAWATAGSKALYICALLFLFIPGAWKLREIPKPQGPLYGIYDVEKFVESGRERPAAGTEPNRWSKVALIDLAGTAPGSVAVRNTDDSMRRYRFTAGPGNARLTWSETTLDIGAKPGTPFVFTYSRPDSEHLVLQNDQLAITLRRVNQPYPLFTRGFHWITEVGFYR